MKSSLLKILFLCVVAVLWSCGQKQHDHDHEGHDHDHSASEPVATDGNGALTQEVDKIHNDAMAKMDKIYKLKQKLKKEVEETPSLAADKKTGIENALAKLDSADTNMMDWMHQYKPFADSVFGEEKAREYLEAEMEKVKKINQDIDDAITKAEQY